MAGLIRQYWKNDAYGQVGPCPGKYSAQSYLDAMHALGEAYLKMGNRQKAEDLFDEIRKVLLEEFAEIYDWDRLFFAKHGYVSAYFDTTKGLDAFASEVALRQKDIEFIGMYKRSNTDLVAELLMDAKDYKATIKRISDIGPIINEDRVRHEKEMPLHPNVLEKINSLDLADAVSVQSATGRKLIRNSVEIKNIEGSQIVIEDFEKNYLGKQRNAFDNVLDYIEFALVLDRMGEKNKSYNAYKKAKEIYSEALTQAVPENKYETVNIKYNFAEYLLEAGYIKEALDSARQRLNYPEQWAAYLSGGVSQIVMQDRWQDFDVLIPEMIKVIPDKRVSVANWQPIIKSLIEKREFERYSKIMDGLDGSNHAYFTSKLIAASFKDKNIPQAILDKAWAVYLQECENDVYHAPSTIKPEGKLSECYMMLIGDIEQSDNVYNDNPLKIYGHRRF